MILALLANPDGCSSIKTTNAKGKDSTVFLSLKSFHKILCVVNVKVPCSNGVLTASENAFISVYKNGMENINSLWLPTMSKWLTGLIVLLSLIKNIRKSDALCTFPDELDGSWYSSHKGLLTFNNTHVFNYPVYLSSSVQTMDFFCDQKSGDLYMLKSITDVYAFQAALIEAYICIELHRISATKYKYYLGTKITTTNNDYMYGAITGTSVSMSTACNRATPYDQATFITLFKEGTLATGESLSTCPHELLNNYGSVVIYNANSSTSCGGNTVKGCEDRTQLIYTYQTCATGLAFSSDGLFYCIHDEIVDGITYVILYNNDTTVDGTTTYRHTCIALTQSSAQISATEIPLFCSDESMTSTSVSYPGIKYAMSSKTEDCYYIISSGKSGGYYFLVVFLVIVLAIVVFTVITIWKKYKNKIRMMELSVYTRETMKTPAPTSSTPNLDKQKEVSTNHLDFKTDQP